MTEREIGNRKERERRRVYVGLSFRLDDSERECACVSLRVRRRARSF